MRKVFPEPHALLFDANIVLQHEELQSSHQIRLTSGHFDSAHESVAATRRRSVHPQPERLKTGRLSRSKEVVKGRGSGKETNQDILEWRGTFTLGCCPLQPEQIALISDLVRADVYLVLKNTLVR